MAPPEHTEQDGQDPPGSGSEGRPPAEGLTPAGDPTGTPAGGPPGTAAGARRRRTRIAIAALVGALVLVAVVLGTASFDDPATKGATRATVAGVRLAGADETRRLLAGVPQDGTLLGDPDAPVTIHEFADLKCPACRNYELQAQPATIATLIRTGRASLRIHFIDVIDPGQGTTDGTGLMNAAYTLAAKDRMWPFVHVLYFNQGPEDQEWASERRLRQIAAGAPGVDPGDVSVRETPATRVRAQRDRRLAKRLGVQATPTVFVEPTGTDRFGLVADPYDDLAAAVRAATPPEAPRTIASVGAASRPPA